MNRFTRFSFSSCNGCVASHLKDVERCDCKVIEWQVKRAAAAIISTCIPKYSRLNHLLGMQSNASGRIR